MRRILLYVIGFVLICFIIPIAFTSRPEMKETEALQEHSNIQDSNKPYTYSKYGTIKLLHTNSREVEELPIDQYLYRSCISRNASKL